MGTEKKMLSGAEMVIQALTDQKVKYIYGYPGGAALHIYDAIFRQKDIQHILVRHEQAATHMADGFARATGKAGTVLVTSGPGATNAITGIATAYMDSIPMVVISCQVPSVLIGQDAFQETDMIGVSRPVVKHNFIIDDPAEIPKTIKKAFYIAESGRPGPVVVDIPKDKTDPKIKFPYEYPATIAMRSYNPVKMGHSGQIKKAIKELKNAKRPIIYSGGGIILGNASEGLRALASIVDAPVTNTLMGLGTFPASDKKFVGMLGMHGTYTANMAMHNSDCILALGARFDDRITNNTKLFCPDARIIHVDIDAANISKTINAHVPIVGPVKQVIDEMIALLKEEKFVPKERDPWWKDIQTWRKQAPMGYEPAAKGKVMKPQRAIEILCEETRKMEPFITSDVGQHQMFVAQYYHFDKPNLWINSGGLGTMGFGFPAAMGAYFADPKKPVFCVTGEASIQMCIQEMSTCRQYGIPVKIFNVNNQSLGMVKQWQDMQYEGRRSNSYMDSLPDFVALAESYGHKGIKVTKEEDLAPAIKKSLTEYKDDLVFLDIPVDPEEHVYPMHIAGNAINDLWINKDKRTPL
ncbi:MAG: acetolactate synthase 3 large subunit [Gammaproteobacteria bacterium]|nr:acetolactate synthase 3 large subunit [Gammaproteobacteria bacterium]